MRFNEIQNTDLIGECLNEFGFICYLLMYYGNVRSIPAKTDFRSRVSSSLYKVLCFTETWLLKIHYDDSYFPFGFRVYRQDRKTNGGGVAIIVHDDFKSTQIQIHDPECESICVKIELQPISIVIYLAYVSEPNLAILLKHHKLIQEVIRMEPQSRIIVLGDFNLHDITWNLNDTESYYLPQKIISHTESEYYKMVGEFLKNMHQLPMYQLSNIKNIASNVLDLVFVNETNDVQVCRAPAAITKIKETDHFHPPLEISFEYESGKIESASIETIEVFSYKRGNRPPLFAKKFKSYVKNELLLRLVTL